MQVYSLLSGSTCLSLSGYSYLHLTAVSVVGSQTMTVSLEQHNPQCNSAIAPYPETWGGVDLRRYLPGTSGDVWIPLSHFRINLQRAAALSFKALFDTSSISMGKIEFTTALGAGAFVPAMVAQSPLHFHCVDPNVVALCIDDGMFVSPFSYALPLPTLSVSHCPCCQTKLLF